MKKLLLLALSASLFACSGDDSSETTAENYYNPPVWIQGTWALPANEMFPNNPLYKFTSDNVCQLTSGGAITNCWKETAELYETSEIDFTAEDTGTETTYEAITGVAGSNVTIKFQKVSETKIKWLNGSTNPELIKVD